MNLILNDDVQIFLPLVQAFVIYLNIYIYIYIYICDVCSIVCYLPGNILICL